MPLGNCCPYYHAESPVSTLHLHKAYNLGCSISLGNYGCKETKKKNQAMAQDGSFTIKRPSYVACDCTLNSATWKHIFGKNPLKGIYRFAGIQTCTIDKNAPHTRPKFEPFATNTAANQGIAKIGTFAPLDFDNNVRVAFVNWSEQPAPPKPEGTDEVVVHVAAAIMGEVVFTPFTNNRIDQRVNLCSGFTQALPAIA